jgi:hypothetical protein
LITLITSITLFITAAVISISLSACKGAQPDPAAATSAADPAKTEAEPPERPAAFTLEFEEPGPGPRAPTSAAFHAQIGVSDYAAVQALTQELGLRCGDTSIRAQMQSVREKKSEEARAAGKSEDAISSASWNKPSKREGLPQIRFSCGKVDSTAVDERERPASAGRLLYVFDSEDLPLRHTSYQRTHATAALAFADVNEALAHMKSVYGEPTKTRHELPVPNEAGEVEFELLDNIEFEWAFSDLLVKISAMRVNPTSVTVGERVEVPIGIRPDAPGDLVPPHTP